MQGFAYTRATRESRQLRPPMVLHGKLWRNVAAAVHTKTPLTGRFHVYHCRQRPTLPHSFPCSTIGGIRLNFRVRNGNGCDPDPMTTGKLAAWGPSVARLRALWGVVPDNLCKERNRWT